ncbi:MAG: DUF3880 domain-containing protein [Desulfonatronovibrionaceae bacterium]
MTIPQHIRLADETGQTKTVSADKKHFLLLREGQGDLFLGLGPDPTTAAELSPDRDGVYLECPQFISAMPTGWEQNIPSGLRKATPEDIPSLKQKRIWMYKPGLRLFPSFWARVLADLRLESPRPGQVPENRLIFFAADKNGLLTPELCRAFKKEGMEVYLLPPDISPPDLANLLNRVSPAHFISINFRGFDPLGENPALLNRAGVRASTWCVDNPGHILTGIKTRAWTQTNIFVTDHWFIPRLKELGAKSVYHLPLAAAPELFFPKAQVPEHKFDFLYVGRFSFPEQQKFFSGLNPEPKLEKEAARIIQIGKRPDFAWWMNKTGAKLWPGSQVRKAGAGAEAGTRMWRKTVLGHLDQTRELTIIGDRDWAELDLSGQLLPPVDYYSRLPDMYASAGCTLNLTNMLMPAGLTQRHFDVWVAGGFLLTDHTPGLDIFPEELTAENTFDSLRSLDGLINKLHSDPDLKKDLAAGFCREIAAKHTYRQRVQTILERAE